MLYISWITDKIAVGPAFAKEDIAEIKKKGICAIIDLCSECLMGTMGTVLKGTVPDQIISQINGTVPEQHNQAKPDC